MCFFVLHRYRVCQHDRVGKLAAFCITAKALASSSKDKNTQSSPREWCGAYEGSPDLRRDDVIKPSYCGQPLFSPAYIKDSGPDSENRGICQNCENAAGQGRDNQQSRRWDLQQTTTRSDNRISSQSHVLGSGNCLPGDSVDTGGREGFNIPQPSQPSLHNPLVGPQQLIRPTTYTPRDRKLPSDFPPRLRQPASSGNIDPTNLSATLQQMLLRYPPGTRSAIEKAIANQPLEQRTQTLQNLRASFEASQNIKKV